MMLTREAFTDMKPWTNIGFKRMSKMDGLSKFRKCERLRLFLSILLKRNWKTCVMLRNRKISALSVVIFSIVNDVNEVWFRKINFVRQKWTKVGIAQNVSHCIVQTRHSYRETLVIPSCSSCQSLSSRHCFRLSSSNSIVPKLLTSFDVAEQRMVGKDWLARRTTDHG